MRNGSDSGREGERMKKLITHNLLLKIMSVVFAFILWLVVVNINDPDIIKTIRSVEITILNEDAITGQGEGQVYTIKENRTASIVVKGPRSKVDKLDRGEIKATVDFSEVSSVGAVPINIVSLPEGVVLQNKITESMKIVVEPIRSQRFPVEIETTGVPADGYLVGDTEVSPNVVNIKAPESVMEQIHRVIVQVDVDGMSTDVKRKSVPLILIDGNGKVIDYAENEHITISAVSLLAGADILRYQSVPIHLKADGQVADGYRYTGMELSRNSVSVKGTRDVMAGVSQIAIPSSEEALDLTDLTGNKEGIIDILPYLPEGTELLYEEERYITVVLKVEKLERKSVHISTDVLTVLNPPDTMEISYEVTPDAMVELEGLPADLALVNARMLNPTIDLGGRDAGVHVFEIEVSVPENVALIRQARITVILTYPEQEESSSVEESSTDAVEVNNGGTHVGGDIEPETETGHNQPETESVEPTIPVMVKPVPDPGESETKEEVPEESSSEVESETPQGSETTEPLST